MKLKKGEVICSNCNGSGNRAKWDQIPDYYKCYLVCDKCQGVGKLDWVEAIVGKKKIERFEISNLYNYHSLIKKDIALISNVYA